VKRHVPAAVAIVFVLAAYAFFAGGGSFNFPRTQWGDTYYSALSEGFFHGHLYTMLPVDPRLMALPFPYDMKAREGIDYIWDASYLNGHYYLYYSPLPALVFYMPYRLLRGGYPRDQLAAAVFAAWAFLAAVAFTRRALALTGRSPQIPFPLWILLIGFGNIAAFLLMDVRVYEVAILAGTAMTATWAYALVRWSEAPSIRRAVWMSVWLALAIAARPNLGVLLFVTATVIVTTTKERRRTLIAAAMPLAIVGAAMIGYNLARFGRPLEFGQTYQLTFVPMHGRAVCSLCSLGDLSRFINTVIHYLFWAPSIRANFPFVELHYADPDPLTSFPMPGSEQVVGVAPLVPLTMLGALFAVLLLLRRDRNDTGTRAGMQIMSAAWLVLFAISTCWWIVSRYSMDWMVLMTISSVVCIEAGLAFLQSIGVRILPLRVVVFALACYSIAMGFMLGFRGPNGAFERNHPELFQKITKALR
jgi:hypothetical protein